MVESNILTAARLSNSYSTASDATPKVQVISDDWADKLVRWASHRVLSLVCDLEESVSEQAARG
jgi:hypothetical protein